MTGEYGDTTQGGASYKRASGTFGMGNLAADRYNVMVVASYQKEGALFGGDRSLLEPRHPFPGKARTAARRATPSRRTSRCSRPATERSTPRRRPAPGPYAVNDPFFPSTRCRFDPSSLVGLLPAAERESLFGSARFAITADVQAYAEASYNRNKINTILQPVPLSDQFAAAGLERAVQPGAVQRHRHRAVPGGLRAEAHLGPTTRRPSPPPITAARPTCSSATAPKAPATATSPTSRRRRVSSRVSRARPPAGTSTPPTCSAKARSASRSIPASRPTPRSCRCSTAAR